MSTAALFVGHPPAERIAYVVVLAGMMTADASAEPEEIEMLREIIAAADIPPEEQGQVIAAAEDPTNAALHGALTTLRRSMLRFALLTDLVTLAEADGDYSPEEQARIAELAAALDAQPAAAVPTKASPAPTVSPLASSGLPKRALGSVPPPIRPAPTTASTAPSPKAGASGGVASGMFKGIAAGLLSAVASSAGREIARRAMGALLGRSKGRSRRSTSGLNGILQSLVKSIR